MVGDIIEIKNNNLRKPSVDLPLWERRNAFFENAFFYEYEVAIVVTAYNRLEKTKRCVESVLQYSSDVNYVLVLIDNGSDDGTLEYFRNVQYKHTLVIHIEKNLGPGFPAYIVDRYISARFISFLADDLILTKNWLSNLLKCIKSDDRIGLVNPVSSNVSNLQQVNIGTYNSWEEMQKLAAKHNISNPLLWEERLRIITLGYVVRSSMLEQIGKIGDLGFIHDFGEDELANTSVWIQNDALQGYIY